MIRSSNDVGLSLECMNRLKHQQCSSQIPPALLCNAPVQDFDLRPAFFSPNLLQDLADLILVWRGDPDEKGSAPDRCDDVRGRVGQENQPQVGAVLLHGPTQRRLCVPGEMVGFVDHHDLEPLSCRHIDLLRLRNLLQEVLHHHSIIVSHIRWRDLKVVDRSDDIEFEFAVGRGLEDSGVDLDLLHSWPIQLLQRRHDPSLFPSPRGTIHEQMWKVSALRLGGLQVSNGAPAIRQGRLTRDWRRAERSW